MKMTIGSEHKCTVYINYQMANDHLIGPARLLLLWTLVLEVEAEADLVSGGLVNS